MTVHKSQTHWRKVLKNFRGAYSFEEEWEIAVLELIANSIDAQAKEIRLSFNRPGGGFGGWRINLLCVDDGKGMDAAGFQDYHDLASVQKDRSSGTIGFAGIGAKLCLDLCQSVYTETSNGRSTLASDWSFPGESKEPEWIEVEPRGVLTTKTGTHVEISNLKAPSFDKENLTKLVAQHYGFSHIPIYINDNQVHRETPATQHKETIERTIRKQGKDLYASEESLVHRAEA